MKTLAAAIALAAISSLVGCSSVQMIGDASPAISPAPCNVTVYLTMNQALKKGPIDELCVINGTSSGSFNHSVATAIEKHKDKACACGATNVYIESRRETGIELASVTMVAFRYSAKPVATTPAK
jgi:hypothetical protein